MLDTDVSGFNTLLTNNKVAPIKIAPTTVSVPASCTFVATSANAADPTEGAVQFLLTSAANDFHAHRPPDLAGFRNVRVGHVTSPNGEASYRLCGQFLSSQGGGKAKWTGFATIKTSGYEQWLGDTSKQYCQGAKFVWDVKNDLSSLLQSRLESMR